MTTLAPEKPKAAERPAVETRPKDPSPKAAEIRKRLDKPREAWEALARDTSINKERTGLAINERIGTRDENGQREVDRGRGQNVERYNQLWQGLQEKGFDGLSIQEQQTATTHVEQVLLQTDAGRSLLVEKGEPEFRRMAADHLRNPDLVNTLREQYKDLVEGQGEEPNPVPEARRKMRDAQLKALKAEAQLKYNSTEQRIVGEALSHFEDGTLRPNPDGTPGQKGDKLIELGTLDAEYPQLQADLSAKEAELSRLSRRLASYQDQFDEGSQYVKRGDRKVDLDVLIDQTGKKVDEMAREVAGIKGKINRRDQLTAERAGLIRRSGELTMEQVDLEAENQRAKENFSAAQAEHVQAMERRDTAERAFEGNFGMLLHTSTKEYLAKRMKQAQEIENALDAEELSRLTEDSERAVVIGAKTRYGRRKPEAAREGFGWWKRRKTEKGLRLGKMPEAVINDDFQEFWTDENVPELLKKSMEAATGPTGERILTDEQIAEKIKDPDFVNKMGPAVIERLLDAKIKIGGMTAGEAQIIGESEWGANLILQKVQASPEVAQELEGLENELGAKDTREVLAKMGGKNLLMLLLALFGAVIIAGAKSIDIGGLAKAA